MAQMQAPVVAAQHYALRFNSLFDPGRALSFPCDADGHVDLDSLSDASRQNYLAARALMGRDYSFPAVVPEHGH